MSTMEKAHISKGGDTIYVVKQVNAYDVKKGLIFIIETEDGRYTPPLFKPYTKIQPEKLDFLVDYGKDINMEDVYWVSKYIKENFEDIKIIEIEEKLSIKETYKALYEYCKDNGLDGIDTENYNIITKDFNNIIKGCGHTPLEFKTFLKQNRMLNVSKTRTYDYNIKTADENGKKRTIWHISIIKKDLLFEIGNAVEEEKVI